MKNDHAYLMHIIDSINRILEYTSSGKNSFFNDIKTQDAVIRNLEIIGEAAKKISMELKSAHSNIPWKRISGMRDKLIHDYFGVNLDLVWDVVINELPDFNNQLKSIISNK